MYFEPAAALGCAVALLVPAVPAVPAVADVPAEVGAPVVEPAGERFISDELPLLAFVRMNDALFPASDCERDAVAGGAPAVPVVPTAPD